MVFRFGYRLYRNPVVMFGLGSIDSTIRMQRIRTPAARNRMVRNVTLTNVVVVVFVGCAVFAFGWQTAVRRAPAVVLAGSTGIWLFYVQHQFDDTTWERTDEWSFNEAADRGSPHLALPKVLQLKSGNSASTTCTTSTPRSPTTTSTPAREQPMFRPVPAVTFTDALRGDDPQAVGRRRPAHGHLEAGRRRQLRPRAALGRYASPSAAPFGAATGAARVAEQEADVVAVQRGRGVGVEPTAPGRSGSGASVPSECGKSLQSMNRSPAGCASRSGVS